MKIKIYFFSFYISHDLQAIFCSLVETITAGSFWWNVNASLRLLLKREKVRLKSKKCENHQVFSMNARTHLDLQVQEKCIKTHACVVCTCSCKSSIAQYACKFSFDFFSKTTFVKVRHGKIPLLIKEISKTFALSPLTVAKQTQRCRSGKLIWRKWCRAARHCRGENIHLNSDSFEKRNRVGDFLQTRALWKAKFHYGSGSERRHALIKS